ncbi:LuxR C-terminal-related transcriptional regulator [Nocardia iowensis]|uniref:LuxR C-terminal-related transcriptional regulator n=1 Tax=Nocardia iowensis TaxID=204891 RepID=A0ABX8S0I6_NOCIO|nr:LuxR C-terminal-related transcriptional regulator [Nocardia iowensis]
MSISASWPRESAPRDEIAETLHLSPGTIRHNLAAINRKVGARNRIEAIRVAATRGWI